jgi:hypothetical protein
MVRLPFFSRSAFLALTPVRFDVLVKIFGVVVVGELLSGLDILFSKNKNALPIQINLAVRRAGVIDAPREVAFDIAVNHRVTRRPKKVATALFLLFVGEIATGVLDDACVAGYVFQSKKPQAAARAPDCQFEISRLEMPSDLSHKKLVTPSGRATSP